MKQPTKSASTMWPVLLAADVRLGVREPGVGVDMERGKRVGNRRSGDVRGLGVCRLRGSGLVSDLLGTVGIGRISGAYSVCAESQFSIER